MLIMQLLLTTKWFKAAIWAFTFHMLKLCCCCYCYRFMLAQLSLYTEWSGHALNICQFFICSFCRKKLILEADLSLYSYLFFCRKNEFTFSNKLNEILWWGLITRSIYIEYAWTPKTKTFEITYFFQFYRLMFTTIEVIIVMLNTPHGEINKQTKRKSKLCIEHACRLDATIFRTLWHSYLFLIERSHQIAHEHTTIDA